MNANYRGIFADKVAIYPDKEGVKSDKVAKNPDKDATNTKNGERNCPKMSEGEFLSPQFGYRLRLEVVHAAKHVAEVAENLLALLQNIDGDNHRFYLRARSVEVVQKGFALLGD